MDQDSELVFEVVCPECSDSYRTDSFSDAQEYVDKHAGHTGHDMEWDSIEIDLVDESDQTWIVDCGACDQSFAFPTESEAERFQADHTNFTDHDTDGPRQVSGRPIDPTDVSQNAIYRLVWHLEDRFDDGVPEGIVYTYFDVKKRDIHGPLHRLISREDLYIMSNEFFTENPIGRGRPSTDQTDQGDTSVARETFYPAPNRVWLLALVTLPALLVGAFLAVVVAFEFFGDLFERPDAP